MQDRYTNPGAAGDRRVQAPRHGGLDEDRDRSSPSLTVARSKDLTEDDYEGSEAKEAPKRWQANYEFIVARCNAELAYLEEYSGLLGQIRKAYPEPFDEKVHSGWKMASKQKASDAAGKKFDKAARKPSSANSPRSSPTRRGPSSPSART